MPIQPRLGAEPRIETIRTCEAGDVGIHLALEGFQSRAKALQGAFLKRCRALKGVEEKREGVEEKRERDDNGRKRVVNKDQEKWRFYLKPVSPFDISGIYFLNSVSSLSFHRSCNDLLKISIPRVLEISFKKATSRRPCVSLIWPAKEKPDFFKISLVVVRKEIE